MQQQNKINTHATSDAQHNLFHWEFILEALSFCHTENKISTSKRQTDRMLHTNKYMMMANSCPVILNTLKRKY